MIAGWSSLVARQAHNLKVLGSNPSPATKNKVLATKNIFCRRLKLSIFTSLFFFLTNLE